MRILNVFNHYLDRGGEALAVDLICDSLGTAMDCERCDFYSADWVGPQSPGRLGQGWRMIHNPSSVDKLRACEKTHRADVWLVHNVFPVASGAVYTEARKHNIPVIQYLHNFRPYSVNGYLWAGESLALGGLEKNFWQEVKHGAWQDSRVRTAWFATVLSLGHRLGWWRSVKSWVAISEFMRRQFISAGVPAADIFTLRHFWRPKAISEPGGGGHYLFLGRLTEAKGIKVLLAAWDLLEQKSPRPTPRLQIAGDGPLRDFVGSRAERMSSVSYVGELAGKGKEEALKASRALIVPSLWWEGLGLVVYEAYDYSRPVLAARSGGLAEIVMDGVTGLQHQPGNAAQLAAHVLELEQGTRLREEMGAAGRRWLLANADEAVWQRRFLAIADHACRRE